MTTDLAGLWPPIATPFRSDGAVDHGPLVRHAAALLAEGARGLVALGTTGEANSLTVDERRAVIDTMVDGNIAPDRIMVGAGACALGDAATMARHASTMGAAAVLLLPPFYYKGVTDDGLFAFVAGVIERAGATPPRILLYHIPPTAVVGWSIDLVGRLAEAYPGVVVGMKDSSGDNAHTARLIAAFPDLAIFPGSESDVVTHLRAGAAGCITASANINAFALARLIADAEAADAQEQLAAANRVRGALREHGLIPSIKAILAARYGDDGWLRVRPPLTAISPPGQSALLADPAVAAILEAAAA